ncbi:MAG: TIGR01459 family HAD-type hydrolase [Verrucomicrobia bacterium]|nr:TIGR01459 family HAD-type hydrolase [Verrucomicrobiota bacterium]MBS0637570.1 TIGR01459 family HAD-type hydrolase [Verrucomicrobiota bacterium]
MLATTSIHENVSSVSEKYPAVLLDAYGVFWGGNEHGPIAGAKEAMQQLVKSGKIVGILSNATQLAAKEMAKLALNGIHQGSHYHFLITSGEIVKDLVQKQTLEFKPSKKSFCLFGEFHPAFGHHTEIFEGTVYTEVTEHKDAGFIYISVPHKNGISQSDPEIFKDEVARALESNLPMLCANPDRFAHAGKPPRPVVTQGSIAKLYEEMGGKVYYIGKPYTTAYQYAMRAFAQYNILDPQSILMVGDTPETDIRGALNAGMDSALITQTGNMADRIANHGVKNAIDALNDIPTYFIKTL